MCQTQRETRTGTRSLPAVLLAPAMQVVDKAGRADQSRCGRNISDALQGSVTDPLFSL